MSLFPLFLPFRCKLLIYSCFSCLELENTHIQKIISAYENFEDIEYFAKVADIDDIDNNKSLLSIQSYVKQKGTDEIYILDESLPKWIEASRSMHIEVANLLSMLKYE